MIVTLEVRIRAAIDHRVIKSAGGLCQIIGILADAAVAAVIPVKLDL
jgi:hypothetical protein